jgi:hypothetical protein
MTNKAICLIAGKSRCRPRWQFLSVALHAFSYHETLLPVASAIARRGKYVRFSVESFASRTPLGGCHDRTVYGPEGGDVLTDNGPRLCFEALTLRQSHGVNERSVTCKGAAQQQERCDLWHMSSRAALLEGPLLSLVPKGRTP